MIATKDAKNWLEWTIFAVSCVLVLSVIIALGYRVFGGGERVPPTIEIKLGRTLKRDDHYAMFVTAFNHGDKTAEAVQIEVTLTKSDGETEKAEFQIQFLPRGASRDGWVTFETDPATAARITARPLGYAEP